jgi:hypothetical protein
MVREMGTEAIPSVLKGTLNPFIFALLFAV